MNIETKLADNFGAAAAALEDAEKVYKDAREAVVALGKPVLVGTKYTVDLTPKEILTFTVESLLAVGLSRAQIEALHRTTLDTPAVRKALKDKKINAPDAAATRKWSVTVEAAKHPIAIAA